MYYLLFVVEERGMKAKLIKNLLILDKAIIFFLTAALLGLIAGVLRVWRREVTENIPVFVNLLLRYLLQLIG